MNRSSVITKDLRVLLCHRDKIVSHSVKGLENFKALQRTRALSHYRAPSSLKVQKNPMAKNPNLNNRCNNSFRRENHDQKKYFHGR
jgi:hypothetical protein